MPGNTFEPIAGISDMTFDNQRPDRGSRCVPQRLAVGILAVALGSGLIATSGVAEPAHGESSLAREMSAMKHAMRRLQTKVHKPKEKEASLELVRRVQTHARKAQKLTPATVAALPEPDRQKALSRYRQQIAYLLDVLVQLENHLLGDAFDQAKATYDKVWKIAKKGHAEFRKKDEHPKTG